ncbi:MAG: hypothetical protein HQ490_01505 [Lutibacter sp.]|nr:hypothetical protein [Lutibacter sp.]
MRFLSWDIGIKNLAYNVIDYQSDKEDPYVIQNWGIINLIDDTDEVADNAVKYIVCDGQLKTGKACGQKSKYIKGDNRYIGYCTKHGNEQQQIHNNLVPVKSKMKCVYQMTKKMETINCNKVGYWLKEDNPYMCYCQTHLKQIKKQDIDDNKTTEYYMDPKRAGKVKQYNIKDLSVILFKELKKYNDIFLNVNAIIIENQPVFKNPTMKSIQMLLYSYFVINGLMKNTVGDITFFNAGKKLEAFTGNHQIAKDKFGHIKSEYKQTKNSSVLFCKEMIKDNQQQWHTYLNAQPKQDDLADTFLMNCCYVNDTYLKNIETIKRKQLASEKRLLKEETIKLKKETKKLKEQNQKLISVDDTKILEISQN